jgi:hypothetical protein
VDSGDQRPREEGQEVREVADVKGFPFWGSEEE